MTRRAYIIRSPDGKELICPSLADLHALYTQGFLGDEDLVRQDGSQHWTRAGAMPALRGVREKRADPRKMTLLLASALALVLALAVLARLVR